MGKAEWEAIRLRKQKDVDENKSKENIVRINHDNQVDDKVLITNDDIYRKLNYPVKCPYPIVQVNLQWQNLYSCRQIKAAKYQISSVAHLFIIKL